MSPWHLLILLVIILLVVGSKKLPGMGRDLGRAFSGFKDGVTGKGGDDDLDEIEAARIREARVEARVEARQETPAPTPEVARAEAESR